MEHSPEKIKQMMAVERVIRGRKGLDGEWDEITFHDDPADDETGWTPLQAEILSEIVEGVLREHLEMRKILANLADHCREKGLLIEPNTEGKLTIYGWQGGSGNLVDVVAGPATTEELIAQIKD